jgi:chromosome segregation ATPase
MADLRILEAQQQESERKLQHAKATKQRRLDYQTALEEKLDKCKYQNGQLSAEMQRSQELLSEGHRQVNEARKASIKAGNDLRDYDSKVSKAFAFKASIIAHQRTQGIWLSTLQGKVGIIDEVLSKSKLKFQNAENELEKAVHFERTLRSDINNENDLQQRIVDQTSKLTSDIAAYERKFETLSSLQAQLKHQIFTLETEEMVILDDLLSQCSVTINALLAEQVKLGDDFAAEQDALKEQIMKKNDDLHRLWHKVVDLQLSEGHDPSLLPSESDCIPVLDLDRIRETLQIEIAAVAYEQNAKDEIDGSIRELSTQLSDLHFQHKKNIERITELHASNTEAQQREESRRTSNTLFIDRFNKIRKDVDEKETLVRALQLEHSSEMFDMNRELESLVDEVSYLKKSYDMYENKNRDIDDEILSIQVNRDKLKAVNEAKLLDLQQELDHVRSSITALQKESHNSNVSTQRTSEPTDISTDEQKQRRRHVDEAKQRISYILKGMAAASTSRLGVVSISFYQHPQRHFFLSLNDISSLLQNVFRISGTGTPSL